MALDRNLHLFPCAAQYGTRWTEWRAEVNLINKAIEHYILYELLTLKHDEQRLSSAMKKADDSEQIAGALAKLQNRAESLDQLLAYLEPVSSVPAPTIAA